MDERGEQSGELRAQLRALSYTGLLCIAIGVGNWYLNPGVALWASLAVSFSIGWSVHLSFILLGDILIRHLHPLIAPIPITALGLTIGLMLGGTIAAQRPLLFFQGNYATLLSGIFFSVVAFLIFTTRGRILRMRAELAHANAEQERQERLITQTELKLLQAQIEPHFLFNTLSNIAGLIHTKPDIAEQTLLNLTTLLRSSLNRTRSEIVTLGQELEIARAYLEIHRTRMQNRLQFHIECPSDLLDVPLPPLLVQPPVENAIKHGVEPLEDGGEISVEVSAMDAALQIRVSDTGMGIGAQSNGSGTGTGLTNVRERLRTLYGGEAKLALQPNQPSGVVALMTIPRPHA